MPRRYHGNLTEVFGDYQDLGLQAKGQPRVAVLILLAWALHRAAPNSTIVPVYDFYSYPIESVVIVLYIRESYSYTTCFGHVRTCATLFARQQSDSALASAAQIFDLKITEGGTQARGALKGRVRLSADFLAGAAGAAP